MKKPFVFQNVSFQVAQQAEIGRGKGNGIELTDTYMHTHPHTPCILSQHYLRLKGLMLRHVQVALKKKKNSVAQNVSLETNTHCMISRSRKHQEDAFCFHIFIICCIVVLAALHLFKTLYL